jgi:aspartyl aminopeptidase
MHEEARAFALGLGARIDRSPTPFHAVAEAAESLSDAGFVDLDEASAWVDPPQRWMVRRDGSLVAGAAAEREDASLRIVGAHTDSPNLRIKPRPDTGRAGARQLGVEVYGGALLNSWLDRDLGLAGRIVVREGARRVTRLVSFAQPWLRVPQLAIHLDRDVTAKGLQLDAQRHLAPVWGLGEPEEGDLAAVLASEAACDPADVLAWDLMAFDLAPAVLAGRAEELLVSGRLDNLCSSFAAVEALTRAAPDRPDHHLVVCLFDHEEVGSVSAAGAGGSLLPDVLERRHGDTEAARAARARSLAVSADMAHATHPNYVDLHEPDHQITLDGGPVIKSNANQRYATEAKGVAAFVTACETAGVPHQRFVNRSDLPCGSTIGPVTAAGLGITTVDVGVAQWAMHSARETAGSVDPWRFALALEAFFTLPD